MKQFKDGEWQYIYYVPREESIAVWPVKTRYADGMVWFDKFEMASLLGWEVRETRRYLDELENNVQLPQNHVALFEDKTSGGRIFNTKCYSASIFLQMSDVSEIEGNQHKLWVLSKSGLDPNHDYEKLVLDLMAKNDEIEGEFKYNILDYLWYYGEKVKEAGGYSDGYFVLFYYVIFSIIPISIISPHFLPIIIALVLLFSLVCVLLLFSAKRRKAIKIHFGLNRITIINPMKSRFQIDGLFLFIHIFSWIAWWFLLAVLLK